MSNKKSLKNKSSQLRFIYDWRVTIRITLILFVFIFFVHVFLQPFDTKQPTSLRGVLDLAGYGFILSASYILLHALELKWFVHNQNRWRKRDEVLSFLMLFTLSTVLSSFYHSWAFNAGSKSLLEFIFFVLFFSVPFCLIIFPILAFLRQRWGVKQDPENVHRFSRLVTIKGENKEEDISFYLSELLYVRAQQNYIEVVLQSAHGDLVKQLVRTTLRETEQEIPEAVRVHRSYLINPQHVEQVLGPKRKRSIKLKKLSEEIPLSSTYQKNIESIMPVQP